MTNTEIKEEILKNSYQKYLDYWNPIIYTHDSCFPTVGYDYFLVHLLTFDDDKCFNKYVEIGKFSKFTIKKHILYQVCENSLNYYKNNLESKNKGFTFVTEN